jgi:hypothetical protein
MADKYFDVVEKKPGYQLVDLLVGIYAGL